MSEGTKPIGVLVADDSRAFRAIVRAALRPHREIAIVGEAANGREAVALTRELKPDVVIMDMEMPELNGIPATAEIVGLLPDTRIVMFSAHLASRHIEAALAAGAVGYVEKEAPHELLLAIRTVLQGKKFLGSGAARPRANGSA